MNIFIIKEEEKERYLQKFLDVYDTQKQELKNIMKFIDNKDTKAKIDIYLIISNNIQYIEEKFYNIKDKSKVLIITGNFEPKHILGCLILTENLFSIKKGEKYILEKIQEVYEQNRSKNSVKREALI